MSAIAEALAEPRTRKVVLAVVDVLQRLTFWTESAGDWTSSTPHEVVGLRVSGQALDAADYTWNRAAGTVTAAAEQFGAGADPRRVPVHAVVRLRLANLPKTLGGYQYRPAVSRLPDLSVRVEPRFGGLAQVGGGALELFDDGTLADLRALDWDGAEVRLYLGADLPRLP